MAWAKVKEALPSADWSIECLNDEVLSTVIHSGKCPSSKAQGSRLYPESGQLQSSDCGKEPALQSQLAETGNANPGTQMPMYEKCRENLVSP